MRSSKFNLRKNKAWLSGSQKKKGYIWWWHNFTGYNSITGEPKSFFIEYFIINPDKSPNNIIYGQLYDQKKKKFMPSYVMVKAGAWGRNAKQIHNFFPTNELRYSKKKLDLRVGNHVLTENGACGSVRLESSEVRMHPEYMSDSGSMEWNLKIEKSCPYNVGYGTSWLFRKLNAFEMYWHAQGVKTKYSGTVILDGVTYIVNPETSFGYADKNWGRDFASPWVWLSSCNLVSEISGKHLVNTCFDVGGGSPKVFGITLKNRLLAMFTYEGIIYDFNFSKFWKKTQVRYSIKEGETELHWIVSASSKKYLLDIDIFCNKNEMLFVNYEAPNGLKLHNQLWNGGTGHGELKLFKKKGRELELIEHASVKNAGCEYGEYDLTDF